MAETLVAQTTNFTSGEDVEMGLHKDGATGYHYAPVDLRAAELGGCTVYHLAAAATTNATTVKAAAGQVYGFNLFHVNDAPIYVTFYDVATTPTPDTTTIKMKFGVPAASTAALGEERTVVLPQGMVFSSGISIAIHKGIATSAAVDASEVLFTMWYK